MQETAQLTQGSARGVPSCLSVHPAGCTNVPVWVGGASDWSIGAAGSNRVSGQHTALGARDEVLLKMCSDGCGETEGESDWEFCTC
jgi:hypothetical protein